jgi:hypothetical protein
MLAVGAFGLYVKLDPFGWIAAKALEVQALWTTSADALLGMAVGLAPVAGFVLGARGVGLEFEKGTADFLLTRPRSRRSLLWTSWAVGAAQMLAVVLVGLCLQPLRTTGMRRIETLDDAVRHLAAFGTVALLVYSLTYAMTTLARHSRNGTGLALLALSAYGGLVVWLRFWYDMRLPIFLDMYQPSYRASPSFLLAVAGWLTVGLALMLLAQWRFQRAEV